MKFAKIAGLSLVAFLAHGAFADAANVLITFSSPGPDKYADNVTVVDGEYYALVWTKGEAFAGFTTSGEPADANQRVIYKAALAKGGRCPLTLFQLDSKDAPSGGTYFVYMLDTRGSKSGATADDLVVTGSALAKSYASGKGSLKVQAVATDNTVDAQGQAKGLTTTSAGLVDATGVAAPVITDFKVVEGSVKITVANVFPGLAYEVRGGLDKGTSVASEVTAKENNTIELTVDKDAAQFFSIKAK